MKVLKSLAALICGLAISLVVVKLVGDDPWHVLKVLTFSSFGTRYDFGMTLFYATPLMLTGLSVATAFRAGLFNIGAEGQLMWGALGATLPALAFPNTPWPLAPILSILGAFLFGAFWGFIPAYLKVKRGSHEVISTIMLNFLASAFMSYIILYWIKDPESQSPESKHIPPQFIIEKISYFTDAPVTSVLVLVLGLLCLDYFITKRTQFGFELRACGLNERAAKIAGIATGKVKILSMMLAGGLAGLVGVVEVLGNAGKFRYEFSPGFGFTGIAVAMISYGHPLGIFFAALLFGALHKGSLDLNIETAHITKDLALVLQALIILLASAPSLFSWIQFNQGKFKKER